MVVCACVCMRGCVRRFFTRHRHVARWQSLTEAAADLTSIHAKLHRRVAEKLVATSVVLGVAPVLFADAWLPGAYRSCTCLYPCSLRCMRAVQWVRASHV